MSLERLLETQRLAHELLNEFGLTEQGWTFRFSSKKTIIGTCYHDEKVIEFSKWYVESHPEEIEDTIRHEIAHALIGAEHGHDSTWRRMAIKCGARPERCYESSSPMIARKVKHNWHAQCGNKDCSNTTVWKFDRLTRRRRYGICPNCREPLILTDLKTGARYRSRAGVKSQ